MSQEEDIKRSDPLPTAPADEADGSALAPEANERRLATAPAGGEGDDSDDDLEVMPTYKRFVYGAYFAGAILVAFVVEKALYISWLRLSQWKPNFGEPRDEILMPAAALVGAVVALSYWRNQASRGLAESVAQELAKVTWPTKKEVVNNTFVVIVTTLFATVFFALMDRFWGFVTNLVYGT